MVGWVQIACEMLAGFMIGPINAWMQSCMPDIGGWVRGLLEGMGCIGGGGNQNGSILGIVLGVIL